MKFEIRRLEDEEFGSLWLPYGKKYFDEKSLYYSLDSAMDAKSTKATTELKKRLGQPMRFNLAALHNGQFAGWSFGIQKK